MINFVIVWVCSQCNKFSTFILINNLIFFLINFNSSVILQYVNNLYFISPKDF